MNNKSLHTVKSTNSIQFPALVFTDVVMNSSAPCLSDEAHSNVRRTVTELLMEMIFVQFQYLGD